MMRPNLGEKPKLMIVSELRDHKRRRPLCMLLLHADGREHIIQFSFEDCTNTITEGQETIRGNNPQIPMTDEAHQYGLDGTEFLQTVLDYAWQEGFRPQGFFDTPNELMRLKAHLNDMRALVFKERGIDLPP